MMMVQATTMDRIRKSSPSRSTLEAGLGANYSLLSLAECTILNSLLRVGLEGGMTGWDSGRSYQLGVSDGEVTTNNFISE